MTSLSLGRRLRATRPLVVALLLIAVTLGYRTWVALGSGWLGDDFVMMDRTLAPGGHTFSGLVGSYAGHVIPGTLYLTWLITRLAPYDFAVAAACMVAMQALAALGLLRFLWVAFGERWGILPPLALYLVSPFIVQGLVWWTPGSHHFMLQAAFGWAMASQVTYLRTRRWTSALIAVVWVLVGLLFFEKTLLVIGALAILTVGWFTAGSAGERLRQVWQRYRFSLVANTTLGLAYLVFYVHYGLSFSPSGAAEHPIGPVADVMVLRSWATGLLGGPLFWRRAEGGSPISFANPPGPLVVLSLVLLVLLCREISRSRTTALRALWLPAFFLGCDVVLVAAGRAALVGPGIGYEFRYLSELSVVTAAALGLMTMPVLGAVEEMRPLRPSVLDQPRFVTGAVGVVAVLSVLSSSLYVHHWNQGRQASATWVGHLLDDARSLPHRASVIDSPAPVYVAWPISHPANLASHLARPLRDDLRWDGAASDHLRMVDKAGHIVPATLTRLRGQAPGPERGCGYRAGRHGVDVRLGSPVRTGGLWVRIGYLASGDSAVAVSAGGATYHTSISRGVHHLYVKAGDKPYDSVRIGRLIGTAELCTDDVIVGLPKPREGQ